MVNFKQQTAPFIPGKIYEFNSSGPSRWVVSSDLDHLLVLSLDNAFCRLYGSPYGEIDSAVRVSLMELSGDGQRLIPFTGSYSFEVQRFFLVSVRSLEEYLQQEHEQVYKNLDGFATRVFKKLEITDPNQFTIRSKNGSKTLSRKASVERFREIIKFEWIYSMLIVSPKAVDKILSLNAGYYLFDSFLQVPDKEERV